MPVIWNARSGTRLMPIAADTHQGVSVRFCRFEGRPRLAVVGRSLQVFDPESASLEWEARVPVASDDWHRLRWLDDGVDQLPLLDAWSHVVLWHAIGDLTPVRLPRRKNQVREAYVSRLNSGQAIAVLHNGVLEIIDFDGRKQRRKIADGVKACAGSPRTNSVYAVMPDRRVCRLDAVSGKRLVELGEVTQESVVLVVDPEETALWAVCANRGHPLAMQAPTDEMLVAFSPDGFGVLQQAAIAGHDVTGTSFLPGMLVTAGGKDATLRLWDPLQPMPLAVISGWSPFLCLAAAGDRLIAGDERGNVWVMAPLDELYQYDRCRPSGLRM